MSVQTGIEWTDATWNPIRGCSLVSEGCRNCYAMGVAARFSGPGQAYEGLARRRSNGKPQWTGEVAVVDRHMLDPLRWKKPRRIFVNSMSDLFHENVSDETIDRVFAVMAKSTHHTFQVLTKRPQRMRDYSVARLLGLPLPNVWLGVSVENQDAADERIPLLLQTPAAVRFLSCEPLLGPVDLYASAIAPLQKVWETDGRDEGPIDWVIVGGESGPHARPMHPDWARAIRDQCVGAGVPFFFKQWGEWAPYVDEDKYTRGGAESASRCQTWMTPDGRTGGCWIVDDDGSWSNWTGDPPSSDQHEIDRSVAILNRWGKKSAGRILDGRTWDEFPAGLSESESIPETSLNEKGAEQAPVNPTNTQSNPQTARASGRD